ncbi:MAG: hypothetical protein GY856_42770, partial [bacterium]|nr:hypothetical protein [bacterium]
RRMVEFSREELEAWNSTASILDGFLAEQAAAACPVDRSRRLTWRVRRRTYGIELGTWEQKLSGRGWTRGRKVSWERLARDRALWTREADRQAVTNIFLVADDFSPLTDWTIDAIAALRALAGHPPVGEGDPGFEACSREHEKTLIFRWEAPEQPVAVEAAELSLRLRASGDGPG